MDVDGQSRVGEPELVANCALLLMAGHKASVNGIGNAVAALHAHPEQWDRFRTHLGDDETRRNTAVDELLRYDTPNQLFERTATTTTEICGHTIERGETVAVLLGAANRDPDVFTCPDTLELTRSPNPHLALGAGRHYCLGAPLARLEIGIALVALARHLPDFTLTNSPPRRCRLRDFRALADDPRSGVRMAPALAVGDLPDGELPSQVAMIPDLRPSPPAEIPEGWQAGFPSTMPVIDMPRYLDYLRARLEAAGVTIETRTVRSLTEAAEQAPLVVNCSGLGAQELAGDSQLHPVFGQQVVMTNPGLDSVFIELSGNSECTIFLPQADRVLCGGIRVPDRWDETPDPEVSQRIAQRCREIEPTLRSAEILDIVTGLRPARASVRVEAERLGSTRCVHNYGHDGNGVSLSWGCARKATALALADSP